MNLSAESQRELERLCVAPELRREIAVLLSERERLRAEVERLDGIRGDLTLAVDVARRRAELAEAGEHKALDARDEARRVAEGKRDELSGWLYGYTGERDPDYKLPWELGAPAAGREEETT